MIRLPGPAWQATIVFVVALLVRLIGASDPPLLHDELYTILAARSHAENGTFAIARGSYERAWAYTVLVGASLAAFGDTLLAARLPSIVAGALLVALVFAWLRRTGGPLAAACAAVLLAFSEMAIHISQFARFYAAHALLFSLSAVAVYAALAPGTSVLRRLALLGVATGLFGICMHLQSATLVGLAALGTWAVLDIARTSTARIQVLTSAKRAALAGVAALALLLAATVFWALDGPSLGARVWAQFRWTALWNAEQVDAVRYYAYAMGRDLPLLFYLFPVAAIVAVARSPRPALFCAITASVILVLHSFGGMKAERYVFYATPFLFAAWGLALAAVVPPLLLHAETALSAMHLRGLSLGHGGGQQVAARASGPRRRGLLATAAVGSALFAALLGNREFATLKSLPQRALQEVSVIAGGGARPLDLAAREERALLAALARDRDVVVTSHELEALYRLGRFDVMIGKTQLAEFAGDEFSRDPRTGGPVISRVESLALVVACHRTGLVLVWPNSWRRSYWVDDAVADYIEQTLEELPAATARSHRLYQSGRGPRAFSWSHEAVDERRCRALRERLS